MMAAASAPRHLIDTSHRALQIEPTRVFCGAGLYQFRAPSEPGPFWCDVDAYGDVVIHASEAAARAGERCVIRIFQDWFDDIAIGLCGQSGAPA